MSVTIKKKAPTAFTIPEAEKTWVNSAVEGISSTLPKESTKNYAALNSEGFIVGVEADYVFALDCTAKCMNLKALASMLQRLALKGMIVAFYGNYSMEDIVSAFCMKPKGEDFIKDPNSSAAVAFFRL